MPPTIAAPPASWAGPSGSPNTTMPAIAPTSGSRFRNAPATSADTLLCASANSAVGATVPATTRPMVAATAAKLAVPVCRPPVRKTSGSVTTAAASS